MDNSHASWHQRHPGRVMRRVCRLAVAVNAGVEQVLYGDHLARAAYHEECIRRIAERPVPYVLTPLAEAALNADAPTARSHA